jgi:hypothetical protein
MSQPPISVRNNNPGNIKEIGISWDGKTGSSGGFTSFQTPAYGVRAMTKQLYRYQNQGLSSVSDMITRWAPPGENNTASYIQTVASDMGIDPNQSINLASNPALTQSMINSMIKMEGGQEASNYFASHVAQGVNMANGVVDPDQSPLVPASGTIDPFNPDEVAPEDGGTAQPAGAGLPSQRRGRDAFYVENILNKYESYSAKWSLHMVHPQNFVRAGIGNIANGNVVTLAEMGVESEINIEAVEQTISMVKAPNGKHRAVANNEFFVTLAEPGGITFYNRLIEAANRLAIPTYKEAAYYLQLEFKGWLPDGTPSTDPVGPFYYPVKVRNSHLRHEQGASFYDILFFQVEDEIFVESNLTVLQDMKVLEVRTFGEYLEKLKEEINKQEELNLILSITKYFPRVFDFKLIEEAGAWSSWEFDATIEGENSERISIDANDLLSFEIKKGSNLITEIAVALYQTTNFQRLPVEAGFAKDKPSEDSADESKLATLAKWWRVEPKIKYGEWEPKAQTYQPLITYEIGPYIRPELIHDAASYNAIMTPGLNQSRLTKIISQNFLAKKLDYTHTGLNTEVLNFNIDFQNMHYAIQPLRVGTMAHGDQLTAGSGDPIKNVVNELEAVLFDARKMIQQARAAINQLDAQIERLSNESTVGGLDQAERAPQISRELSDLQSQREELESQIRQGENTVSSILPRIQSAISESNTRNFSRLTQPSKKYITQSEIRSTVPNMEPENTFHEGEVDSEANSGPNKNREESSKGSLLLGAVEVNLNSISELQQCNFHVRGDPYWLGQPGGAGNGAPYQRGTNYVFFNMNFPTYPLDSTGLITFRENDFSLTAVYAITMVRARYSDGQFTMDLMGFRDTMTKISINKETLLSGIVDYGTGRQGQGPFQSPGGDGASDGTSPDQAPGPNLSPASVGTGTGTVTDDMQGVRNQPVASDLRSILQTAGFNSGVNVSIRSGGQPDISSGNSNRTGSTRHDNGHAADVALFSNGRRLSLDNAADVPIIQTFVSEAKKAGATGFGAGNGYMGNNTFHIDNASKYGQGSAGYWGGQLDNGTYRSRNAPRWLRQIVTGT